LRISDFCRHSSFDIAPYPGSPVNSASLSSLPCGSIGTPLSLGARWVFPVSGPPLENGVVEITDGRISAIHNRSVPNAVDLGNAAIIPGLVNAHTHLELSDVAAPLHPAEPFTAWLKAVIAHRQKRSKSNSVARGSKESASWGTTAIGDIVAGDERSSDSDSPGPRVVAFLECLGLAPERAAAQLDRARAHLADGTAELRGLSPHAPYSVHPDLFRRLVDLAVQSRAPAAMHLAETRAELDLLAGGTGEFRPFLEELGAWRPDAIPPGTSPLDYLRELARVVKALVIHGNYLDDTEINFVAAHPNISVVYCPRTHAFFGHDPHPWRRLLARDVNVALGTDSRASNPDLSLWNELLFLRQRAPEFDAAPLLRLGTFNGACALGLESEIGSLAPGKSADLAIIDLAPGDSTDPYVLLFRPENQIGAVVIAGARAGGNRLM
jgi:cytosine/adenosine deaminase-related metal-dependent hydrolase